MNRQSAASVMPAVAPPALPTFPRHQDRSASDAVTAPTELSSITRRPYTSTENCPITMQMVLHTPTSAAACSCECSLFTPAAASTCGT